MMPRLPSRPTSAAISTLFSKLDYATLGPVYCYEGGDEFWQAKRKPCERLGNRIARALAGAGVNVMINGFGPAAEIEQERAGIESQITNLADSVRKKVSLTAASDDLKQIEASVRERANLITTNAAGVTVNRWNTTGFLVSSAISNESGYLSVKMARGLGMVAVDTQARI